MFVSTAARRIVIRQNRTVRREAVVSRIRKYSRSTSVAAWWNPFSRGDAQVASSKSQGTEADNPRRVQERKDVTLVLLALEFRRLSLEHENASIEREKLVDMAFDELEKKGLDEKTRMQLRRELQTSLHDQMVHLFQTFGKVDENLPDLDEESPLFDEILRVELERTIDELANPTPLTADKGTDPKIFLDLKRGALNLLINYNTKAEQEAKASSTSNDGESEGGEKGKEVSWVDADEFGYHETIDDERNALIRHYQTVNMCRSAKMRDEWGYSVIALQSSVPGAGRGVYLDGFAKAGSILAFQPGEVWAKEHLLNLPAEVERQLEKNDNYQMSLRSDDFMIDSRKSPYTVLTGNNSNLMSLGHVINHPTPSKPPNCRSVMVDFTKGMELGKLKRYIPNTYARARNLSFVGTLLEGDIPDMHGMCLIATRDICNEELFYDYRLMTPHKPQWYTVVQDDAYEIPEGDDEEEETK